MAVRPATSSELLPISHICAAAFYNDNLFGELIHPCRHEYPDDMHLYWLQRFRAGFPHRHNRVCDTLSAAFVSSTPFIVATARDQADGEHIVGVAHWMRKRAGAYEIQANDGAEKQVNDLLSPNRAADPQEEDIIERAYPHLLWQWTGRRAESWYLACLAIDPHHQGQGHGRELVRWGLEQAAKENVCVSVISARGKDGFYKRCGFDVESGNAGDGEGNPLRGIEGGVILFRDV